MNLRNAVLELARQWDQRATHLWSGGEGQEAADLRGRARELRELVAGEPDGAALIAAERDRQQREKGWDDGHDDGHTEQELLRAAIGYASCGFAKERIDDDPRLRELWLAAGEAWPWPSDPIHLTGDPVGNLTRAGALIAAEIDRINRLRASGGA